MDKDTGGVARQKIQQLGPAGGERRELEAVKSEAGWKSANKTQDMLGMDMLLWRLGDLKYEQPPSDTLPKTAEPLAMWELFDAKGKPLAGLEFYLDPGLGKDICWVKVLGREKYYPVQDQLLEDLQAQLRPDAKQGRGRVRPGANQQEE